MEPTDFTIIHGTGADFYEEIADYYLQHADTVSAIKWLKSGYTLYPLEQLKDKISILEEALQSSN